MCNVIFLYTVALKKCLDCNASALKRKQVCRDIENFGLGSVVLHLQCLEYLFKLYTWLFKFLKETNSSSSRQRIESFAVWMDYAIQNDGSLHHYVLPHAKQDHMTEPTFAAKDELGFSNRSQSFMRFSVQHVLSNSSPSRSRMVSASRFSSSFICSFFWWYRAWQHDSR